MAGVATVQRSAVWLFSLGVSKLAYKPHYISSDPQRWGWDVISERHLLAPRDFSTPFLFALEAGNHTLAVHQREAGSQLDQLLVTNDLTLIPDDPEQTQ